MSTQIRLTITFLLFTYGLTGCFDPSFNWSQQEISLIKSLALPEPSSIHPLSLSHDGNEVWDNPKAAKLGHRLFFDKRLSHDETTSCASCHQPEKQFSDNTRLSKGILSSLSKHTPSIIGIANSKWFFWDGRSDSLWPQALKPLENPNEHGTNRLNVVHIIDQYYRNDYEAIFGPLPRFDNHQRFPLNALPAAETDTLTIKTSQIVINWNKMTTKDRDTVNQVFSNIGKSIAAYESLIMPGPGRFDRFAKSLQKNRASTDLSPEEQAGLKLFIDDQKGRCIRCHNGPLLTNHDFHATGIFIDNADDGRISGIEKALSDPFNCLNTKSKSLIPCDELLFAKRKTQELKHAFKVPTLRNISLTAPYMHDGNFSSLGAVLQYYNKGIPRFLFNQSTRPFHFDLEPLHLLPHELKQLEAFLNTLISPVNIDRHWLTPPLKKTSTRTTRKK